MNAKSNVTRLALYRRIGNGANRNAGQSTSALLDPIDIACEAAAVERECRQAILTSLLPEDELIGRLRSSMVVAKACKDGGQ